MSEGRIVRQNFSSNNLRTTQDAKQVEKIVNSEVRGLNAYEEQRHSYATSAATLNNTPLITEVCELPSKGLLYGGELGSCIELRAMTTVEERMRLSGENFWSTMSNILNRCLVNSDFDTKNLADFDFFAALVKLRIITYGNMYKTYGKCLKCQRSFEHSVNLDNLNITELPDDFVEPIEIGPLPKSGDVLGIRFLRVFDHIDIINKTNAYKNNKKKNDLRNPEYTLEMEKMLVTVNGNPLDSMAKHRYIENMIGMDSSYFHDAVEKLFYGVHRVGTDICEDEDCDGILIYQVAPDDQFFRTTFDN